MIESLTVTNPKGESLTLELTRPELSGIIIQGITGLGPVKATVNTSDIATSDGSLFNSIRASSRNIVFTLVPMSAPLVEYTRHKIYKYFPLKGRVRLDIKTDYRSVYTYGYVESNEPNIFSEMETVQISIVCTDPYFREKQTSASAFYGVEPLLEFPFSNEDPVEKKIEISRLRLDSRAIIEYDGDAETGGLIVFHANNLVRNIVLQNTFTLERLEIDTDMIKTISGFDFNSGDEIVISTIPGDLYARLLRNGKYTNVISALGKDSDFLRLTPGTNIFAFDAEEGRDSLIITFKYNKAYGGI